MHLHNLGNGLQSAMHICNGDGLSRPRKQDRFPRVCPQGRVKMLINSRMRTKAWTCIRLFARW